MDIQAYTCCSLKPRLVFTLVLALGQPADSFTRHMMAGMRGGQKGRGRALRRGGGGRSGGGGGSGIERRLLQLLVDFPFLIWFNFSIFCTLLLCCPPPHLTNLTFLIQIAGCESTCLENTVAFLSFKHAIRHRARTLASVVARSPELCPAFLTVDKRRLINFTPSFQK